MIRKLAAGFVTTGVLIAGIGAAAPAQARPKPPAPSPRSCTWGGETYTDGTIKTTYIKVGNALKEASSYICIDGKWMRTNGPVRA